MSPGTSISMRGVKYEPSNLDYKCFDFLNDFQLFESVVSAERLRRVNATQRETRCSSNSKQQEKTMDVPTVSESGVPGYSSSVWYGMLAPAKIPSTVVQLLNTTSHKVMQEPAIKTQLLSLGQELMLNTPEEFVRFIQDDREKWAKVVKESGAK